MSRSETAVFSRSTIGWLAGLAAGSLLFAFLWSGLAGDLNEPHTAGNDSYSRSALGHRAFAELLSRSGVVVRRRRTHQTGWLEERAALILAEPTRDAEDPPGEAEIAALFVAASAHQVPVVIVLPKRSGVEDPEHPGWIAAPGVLPPDTVLAWVRPFGLAGLRLGRQERLSADGSAAWGERIPVTLSQAQFLVPSEHVTPILACDSALLIARIEPPAGPAGALRPALYVVSDPDLVSTMGLGTARNAAAVSGLLIRLLNARTVWFDETLHHPTVDMSLATEMLRYPLLLGFLQTLLLLGFLIWSGVGRFGKARDPRPPDESKRALVDSIAGLLRATGRPADTLEAYLDRSLRVTAERYGLPAGLRPAELGARLGGIARSRGVRRNILHLQYLVEGLKLSPERHTQAVVRTAQEIHGWYEDMNHDH